MGADGAAPQARLPYPRGPPMDLSEQILHDPTEKARLAEGENFTQIERSQAVEEPSPKKDHAHDADPDEKAFAAYPKRGDPAAHWKERESDCASHL